MAYDDAVALFEDEYARSNGTGTAGLPLDGWTADDVKNFLRQCGQAATNRGASVKGARVGVNVARKLGITTTVGDGENFEGIPCLVTIDDDDRLDLTFGPAVK